MHCIYMLYHVVYIQMIPLLATMVDLVGQRGLKMWCFGDVQKPWGKPFRKWSTHGGDPLVI